jgi:threonine aldolase
MRQTNRAQQFASDNNAGMCPEALQALMDADATGHASAYGDDRWTAAACDAMRAVFDTDCQVFFVFNGTAANALALAAMCQPYNAVVCHQVAHVEVDECGAPEFFSGGLKLLTMPGGSEPAEAGKLTPAAVRAAATRRSDLHAPRAKAVTLTQSTECGTVYSVAEIEAITATAKELGLRVHMDGARFANAVASLDVHPSAITWRAGVDVLSFGGTKNGLPLGEAVVFFDKDLAEDFAWRAKQAGQLASKMRYVSAPWLGLLTDNVWLKHARHANTMAQRLSERLAAIKGAKLMYPIQANVVFAELPVAAQAELRAQDWRFYTFFGETGCRLMCAWDTSPETVDLFADDIARAIVKR